MLFRFIINQKMQRKLYISNLDSPLGYHIAQYFREDNLEVNPSLKIIGSSCSPEALRGVHTKIDFSKYPQIACRTALDCDTIILDLRSNTHQAELIIRFLQDAVDKSWKRVRVIGLSSLLTWEGMKAFQLQPESSDKQAMMANILDESKWRPLVYSDSDASTRIPGHFSTRCYELENLLLGLNKKQNIKATVIASGLIYGKQNQFLQSQIINALSNQNLTVWGNGNNLIPLLHIDTFLESLKTLIQSNAHYSIVVDRKTFSQRKVKELILSVTGCKAQLKRNDPLFLDEDESIWTFPLLLKPSIEIQKFADKRNFQDYCIKNLLEDICEYTDWEPNQCVIFNDKVDSKTLQTVTKQFQNRLQIITQEEIDKLNQQITLICHPPESQPTTKKQNKVQKAPQQSEPIPDYSRQAIQRLLKHRKYRNYIVSCSSKMRPYLIESCFYKQLLQLVKVQQAESKHKQVIIDSQQYFSLLGAKPIVQEKEPEKKVFEQNNEKKPFYEHPRGLKKDDKVVLTTQYLMDNVLVAVSEARFKMKSSGKQNIGDLIEELKAIWVRGNYRSCIDENKRKEYFGQNIR